jgi:mono/diheme cytochrome c family protein
MMRRRGILIGLTVGLGLATALPAPATTVAGRSIWIKYCAECHGASGEGKSSGQTPPTPSLRTTRLDRAGLVETVSCGRPGTPMSGWLDGAYTAVSCFGRPLDPPDGDATSLEVLDQAEIDALVDYLVTEIAGR